MLWQDQISDLGDFGLGVLGFGIVKLLHALQLYAVERLFVARQELIVRIGRATQRRLSLPRVLWIVSEEEPGLSRHAIRNSANSLALPFSVSAAVLLRSWLHGINVLHDAWAFMLGIAVPTSCVLGVWYVLAASQHARSTHPAPTDLEEGSKPFNMFGLDEDGARIIMDVLTKRGSDIFSGQGNNPPENMPGSGNKGMGSTINPTRLTDNVGETGELSTDWIIYV
ncbi:hypothetical protein F5X97DRAFT_326328 [Nemania serpens]|nr:hypothetical protein F5X97DRAFT_326328 [Nemania serpens]